MPMLDYPPRATTPANGSQGFWSGKPAAQDRDWGCLRTTPSQEDLARPPLPHTPDHHTAAPDQHHHHHHHPPAPPLQAGPHYPHPHQGVAPPAAVGAGYAAPPQDVYMTPTTTPTTPCEGRGRGSWGNPAPRCASGHSPANTSPASYGYANSSASGDERFPRVGSSGSVGALRKVPSAGSDRQMWGCALRQQGDRPTPAPAARELTKEERLGKLIAALPLRDLQRDEETARTQIRASHTLWLKTVPTVGQHLAALGCKPAAAPRAVPAVAHPLRQAPAMQQPMQQPVQMVVQGHGMPAVGQQGMVVQRAVVPQAAPQAALQPDGSYAMVMPAPVQLVQLPSGQLVAMQQQMQSVQPVVMQQQQQPQGQVRQQHAPPMATLVMQQPHPGAPPAAVAAPQVQPAARPVHPGAAAPVPVVALQRAPSATSLATPDREQERESAKERRRKEAEKKEERRQKQKEAKKAKAEKRKELQLQQQQQQPLPLQTEGSWRSEATPVTPGTPGTPESPSGSAVEATAWKACGDWRAVSRAQPPVEPVSPKRRVEKEKEKSKEGVEEVDPAASIVKAEEAQRKKTVQACVRQMARLRKKALAGPEAVEAIEVDPEWQRQCKRFEEARGAYNRIESTGMLPSVLAVAPGDPGAMAWPAGRGRPLPMPAPLAASLPRRYPVVLRAASSNTSLGEEEGDSDTPSPCDNSDTSCLVDEDEMCMGVIDDE